MTTARNLFVLVTVLAATFAVLCHAYCPADEVTIAETKPTIEPIEKDMHEFMEYVFEPTFTLN